MSEINEKESSVWQPVIVQRSLNDGVADNANAQYEIYVRRINITEYAGISKAHSL
jgi:hypothetical protein